MLTDAKLAEIMEPVEHAQKMGDRYLWMDTMHVLALRAELERLYLLLADLTDRGGWGPQGPAESQGPV